MDPARQAVLPPRPRRPPATRGQQVAGRILRIFGYVIQILAGTYWCLLVLGTGFWVVSEGISVLPSSGLNVLLCVAFYVTGRVLHQFGCLVAGRAGELGGRLFVKKLVRDLVFEVAGLIVIPAALAAIVFLAMGEWKVAVGLGALAALLGFGLPRVMHFAVRSM